MQDILEKSRKVDKAQGTAQNYGKKHGRTHRRFKDHKDEPVKIGKKETRGISRRLVTLTKGYDPTETRLSTREERKLKEKYDQVRRHEKKQKKIKKAWESLQKLKHEEKNNKLVMINSES